MSKDRPVGYIDNGTVVDHIPSEVTFDVLRILRIDPRRDKRGSSGWGLRSDTTGDGKGIIKVQDRELTPEEYNRVALVASRATINAVRGGKIANKTRVEIPQKLEGLVYCANPRCITNNPAQKESPVIYYDATSRTFTCHYCNHTFLREQVRLVF